VTPRRLKQPIASAKSLIFQMQCLNSLNEIFAGLSGAASLPESGNTGKPSSADFCIVSMVVLRLSKRRRPHPQLKVKTSLTPANLYPPFLRKRTALDLMWLMSLLNG